MQAALIAMTILGCNDSVTQCNYVATVDKHWETVATCDAESEKRLRYFANAQYPTVIAMCEAPKPSATPEPPKVAEQVPPPPETPEKTGLRDYAIRVAERVRSHLPSGEGVRDTLKRPVHFVSSGYSWAVQRFTH